DTEPVCLISCSHRSPEGGCGAGEGRHGAMKPADRARGRNNKAERYRKSRSVHKRMTIRHTECLLIEEEQSAMLRRGNGRELTPTGPWPLGISAAHIAAPSASFAWRTFLF